MHRAFALSDDPNWAESGVPVGRRSAARLRLALPAHVITTSKRRRCILIDLSRTGAQIGLEDPLSEGTDIFLQVSDIDQFGTIVRRVVGENGGFNGIQFEEPLSDNRILAMRHFADSFEIEAKRALRREASAWVSGAS